MPVLVTSLSACHACLECVRDPYPIWVNYPVLHEAGWIIALRLYGYLNGWMEFPYITGMYYRATR